MLELIVSRQFEQWLDHLRDAAARQRIKARLSYVAAGTFGDWKPVGSGVCELRINYGPGYRVYYTMRGATVVILLCGGDKSSQSKDIAKALKLTKELES